MSCGKATGDQQAHLVTTSTSDAVHYFTPWMSSIGMDNVKAAIKAHGASGYFQCQLVIQVATTRTDDPGAPVKLDEALVGDGERCTGVESVSQYTGSNYFVRFGVAYSVQSGQTALSQADVSFTLSYTQCGQVVGGKSLSLSSSTTTDVQVAVTGWLPALMAQKVLAMVIARSLGGNFEWKLCYRTATTSKENPSGWTSLEAGSAHGAGEFCLGEFTLSLDSVMWVQLGVMYHSTAGTGDCQVDISYAVRRS